MEDIPNRWYYEYIAPDLFLASHLTDILYTGTTRYQRVEIIETSLFGRCLVLDGRTQSSEIDEFIYHETLIHPALIAMREPRTVFIAGGGEGATAREVLSHKTVERVVMVDLDRELVELCQKYLPNHHKGAFEDSRLELIFTDAWKYLEESKEQYDLLVMDIPDPLENGPAYLLFTKEFYKLAKKRIKPGGAMVVQAGPSGPLNYRETLTAVNNTIRCVFGETYPLQSYIPSFGSPWGFVIASSGLPPTDMSAQKVDACIESRLTHNLLYYDGITHQGMFHLPTYVRQGLKTEKRVITKGNPLYAV
jgi:spermidine synthase